MFTSSITIIWTLSTFATPFFIKSRILPGVAMTTCTDVEKRTEGETQSMIICIFIPSTLLKYKLYTKKRIRKASHF